MEESGIRTNNYQTTVKVDGSERTVVLVDMDTSYL